MSAELAGRAAAGIERTAGPAPVERRSRCDEQPSRAAVEAQEREAPQDLKCWESSGVCYCINLSQTQVTIKE